MEKESILFTPGKIGPLTLRNRTIRAAAFESMCPGNAPSDMLYDYHKSVASGGIGMTTWPMRLLRKADFLSNVSSGCAQISSPD